MARRLAATVGYRYIDSGAMYRAVALYALRNGWAIDPHNIDYSAIIDAMPNINIDFGITPQGTQRTLLNGEDVEDAIREMEVSRIVSQVAAVPQIRERLVNLQRALGSNGGIVMDGRDIGTTVFPKAELKIFVTASPEVRAQRRFNELKAKGEKVDYNDVLENVKQRDYTDTHRSVSPLVKASDAIELDNTSMTLEQQEQWLLEAFQSKVGE